ncbi:MAG: branched-chain amino acid ABC transporter permease [Spirochaetia bacterium]|nr:branched-chain amino acid ABC transporter permease [Spirochaetia bacterium]
MTENKIYTHKIEKLLPSLGVVVFFAALAVAITGSLWSTLIILIGMTGLLIYGEKHGQVDRAYIRVEERRSSTLTVLIICIVLLPFILKGNSYFLHIAVMAGIYAIVALGLNFQIGSMGQVNFAPAAMFGVGAYTSAMVTVRLGASPWIGLIAAMIVTAGMGIVFGFPALKTRGFYFSLVTIALQTIFILLVVNTEWLGGPNGIPGIPAFSLFGQSLKKSGMLLGTPIPYQMNYIYLTFTLLLLLIVISKRLYSSRIGLAWNAIEEDEIVASTQGINLTKVKLLSFSIGSVFAGIAGSLYAHYTSFIGVEDFDFNKSLIFICMVLLGGMDNPIGVTIGAIMLTVIDEKLRIFADYRMLMYSIILIVVLVVRSQGLLPKRNRKYPLGEEN